LIISGEISAMKVEVLLRCTLRGEPFCFSLQRTGDIDRRSLYHDGEVFIFPVELNEGVVAFQKKSVVSCSLLLRSWDPRNILSLSQVKIWCTWTPMISFGKKNENHISDFQKKSKKIFACSQLFIAPTCKKSCSNTLHFGLHKIDKRPDLSTYILNLQILTDFVIFLWPTI
jgi:hypothetical protein